MRRSEERFRKLVQNVSDVISIVEADGIVRYVSPSIERVLGYKPEDRVGRTTFELVHPDDVVRAKRLFAEALRSTGTTLSLELRLQHRDGSWRFIEAIGTNLLGDPTVDGIVLNSRDITERKRAEEMQASLARRAGLRADVSAALAKGGALQGILQRCTEAIVEHLDAAFARVWTLNTGQNVLNLEASAGMYTHLDGAHSHVPVGRFKIGLIAQERLPHLTNDVLGDPCVHDKEWAKREGMAAFAGYPLVVEDRLVGVVAMFARKPLSEDTLDVLASVADIIAQGIERRRAEKALRESERTYRSVVDNVKEVVFQTDATGLWTFLNRAWTETTGFSVEETIGNNFLDYVHPDDRQRNLELFRLLIEREKDYCRYAIRYLIKDGGFRWVEVWARLTLDENGSVIGTSGTLNDITERKWAEEVLRHSEERFRSLIRTSSDIITILEYDGTVRYANPATERVLGYLPEERIGTKAFDSVHADDRERAMSIFAEILGSPGIHGPVEFRVPRADGSWCYLEHSVNNLLDDPSIRGIVVSSRDTTERRQAEERLREANRRLEELAVLKADFSAMVAHEIDTPLAVIRGYAEMVSSGELEPAEQSRALAKIQTETEVLNALVADVRAAAAVEREDFTIEPQPVPVRALLDEGARFGVTLPGNHPLVIENAAGEERVWADKHRIGQVLRNLLSNAAKYSLDGTPIELRAKPGEDPGRVRIELTDSGPGIHPDDVSRVFQKFDRGRDRCGRKVAGTGLGLYLSRRIVRAHGSDLTLDFALEGGSVFGFELEAAR